MSVHHTQMVHSQKKWEDYLFLSWGMTDIHEDLFIMIEKLNWLRNGVQIY